MELEPMASDLQAVSDLNRAVVCNFVVQPAEWQNVDWYECDWCVDLAEAVEVAKTHYRVTKQPVTVWRTPNFRPYALATLINGEWITPRAATYRGVPYWAHLLKAM